MIGEETGLVASPARGHPAGSRHQGPYPHAHAASPPQGSSGSLPTWVVGKVLRLTSFSLPINDIEVHLHRRANVLIPVLGDLNKKHVLEGRSCH